MRKLIFKMLLGKDNYENLVLILKEKAKEYSENYKNWKPKFEYDINLNNFLYKTVINILKKLGVKIKDARDII